MNISSMKRRMKDKIKFKTPTGARGGDGSLVYGEAIEVQCRKEDGFFEAIDNNGVEIKSKTHIINFDSYIKEKDIITEVNGEVLGKPLVVKADRRTPAIKYDATLYDCWI